MVKIIYLLFFLAVLVTAIDANEGFILDSIEEANRLSQSTNKPLLMVFGAEYCQFCNNLKQDIINGKLSPEIDPYIICYIDVKNNTEAKTEYGVSLIPDSRIWINNREVSKNKGYSLDNYRGWLLTKHK